MASGPVAALHPRHTPAQESGYPEALSAPLARHHYPKNFMKQAAVIFVAVLGAIGATLWANANESKPANKPAAAAPQAGGKPSGRPKMPPASVSVVEVRLQDLARSLQATGHAVPLQSVHVRAQVSALVQGVHVKEGQHVQVGDLLFTLDSRTARADAVKAKATLARSQANLLELQRQLKRSQALQAQNFVSSSATDTLAAQVQAQQAQVDADAAALRAQELRVSLYRITAPIAGRVGSVDVFPGSLVGNDALLTITQMKPMGVQFALPQAEVGAVQRAGVGAPITVQMSTGLPTVMPGRLRFIDSQVNPSTSMLTLKAEVDNADQALWPGTSVNVKLDTQALKQVAVLPQAAVMLREGRTTVWLVGEDNKAAPRPVEVLEAMGERVAVRGVQAGDRVVVDGRQFVRPGAAVRVVSVAQE
jgi:RND family efflux transporter MFP subunit